MSETSGAQDASTLVLRLSVPADADYRGIVQELAARVAAYVGDPDPDGKTTAAAIDDVVARVASADGHADIVFEFRRTDNELLIEARSAGRSADVRHALPS
jgi:hypothetical protein